MKKRLTVALSIAMLTANVHTTPLFAANDVKVIYDGSPLAYTETQPGINQGRVMVPIRETANYFGMTTSWDEENQTMTFEKNGRTSIHTLNQKFIYADGAVKSFDQASFSQDGRTMMPIRMLAEALGAKVTWDELTSSVIIENTSQATVLSAVPNKTTVNTGESVTVTAAVSGEVTSLQLQDSFGNVLAQSDIFTQTGGNKIFTVSYAPKNPTLTSQKILACAGNNGTYFLDTATSFALSVTMAAEVLDVSVGSSSLEVGTSTDVTVLASNTATKVKITNDYDSDMLETEYSTAAAEGAAFDFRITPVKVGTTTYTVFVGTDKGYTTSSKTFTLIGQETIQLIIKDVEVYDSSVAVGDSTKVIVTAGNSAAYIKILDSSNNTVVSKTSGYTTQGSDRVWNVYVTVTKSGSQSYYVYAYDETDNYIQESFTLSGNGSSSDLPQINSANLTSSTVYAGNSAYVDVYTNTSTTYVYIVDNNGNTVATRSYYSYESDGSYIWPLSFTPDTSQTYSIYAENDNGDSVYTTVYITVE